jgi:dimethylaniline monooxygenase (N-oxide forming)
VVTERGGGLACIVGAGAAGIVTAKTLFERGIAFDWFERSSRLGGLWAEDEDGYAVGYRSLHINSSKRQAQFSDFPIPDAFPDFPSRSQVAAYLGSYARHFGISDRASLGRTVTDIAQAPGGRWTVEIDAHERRTYDAVLVASGHHSTPKLPLDAGHGFGGEVLHSHDVRNAAAFEGRHVLVVGFGNSAVDIASLVSTTAAHTYLSTRRGAHVVPKYLFGRPFDEFPAPRWPRALRWGCYELAMRLTVGSLERYGLPAPRHRFGRAAVTISSDLFARIVHGNIQPRPAVAELHDADVTFADGRSDPVDTIVYCTGYAHSMPFLERRGLDPADSGYRLFEQIWDPRFDGLAHVGLVQPLGSLFPVFEAQARILADWIEGAYVPPDRRTMWQAIERAGRRRGRRYIASERHALQVDEPDYRRGLERERRRGAARAARRDDRNGGGRRMATRAEAVS